MNLAIAIGAALGIAVVTFHNKALGVAAVLLFLPSYLVRFQLAGIPFTLLETFLLTVCAVTAVQIWREQGVVLWWKEWMKQPLSQAVFAAIAALWIAGGIGLAVTPDLRAGLGIFKAYLIEPALFCIALMHAIRSRRDLSYCLWALGLSAAFIAAIALTQYATGWGIPEPWHELPGRRATAFYGYPNAVGLYLAPIITLLSGIVLLGRTVQSFHRILAAVVVALGSGALLAARVDGAFVACAAGVYVLCMATRWRWIVLVFGVALAVAAFSYEPSRSVLLFQDVSGDVRLALWKGTMNLLRHEPLVGAGLAGFPLVYDVFRLPSHVELLQYPHNLLLDFWTELGVLGAAWISTVVVSFFILAFRFRRVSKTIAATACAVMISTVVYGIVDVPYFKNDLSVLFWAWLGFLVVAHRLFRQSGTSKP